MVVLLIIFKTCIEIARMHEKPRYEPLNNREQNVVKTMFLYNN